MKIKVTTPFNDKENDLAFRDVGTELEVTEQRGKLLIEKGFAVEVKPEQPANKGKKTEQKD